jgi:hypothetical protein
MVHITRPHDFCCVVFVQGMAAQGPVASSSSSMAAAGPLPMGRTSGGGAVDTLPKEMLDMKIRDER